MGVRTLVVAIGLDDADADRVSTLFARLSELVMQDSAVTSCEPIVSVAAPGMVRERVQTAVRDAAAATIAEEQIG